jgi:hypothetical protein
VDFAHLSQAELAVAVSELRGCLSALSGLERRFLALRAGLNGQGPRSRRAVARRLGISTSGAGRVERRALQKLRVAARTRGCAQAPSGAFGLASRNLLVSPLVAHLIGAAPAVPAVADAPPALDPDSPRLTSLGGGGIGWKVLGPVLGVLGLLTALVLVMTGASLGQAPAGPVARRRVAEDELFADWEAQLVDEAPKERVESGSLVR